MNLSLVFLFVSDLMGEFNGVFELIAWKFAPFLFWTCVNDAFLNRFLKVCYCPFIKSQQSSKNKEDILKRFLGGNVEDPELEQGELQALSSALTGVDNSDKHSLLHFSLLIFAWQCF